MASLLAPPGKNPISRETGLHKTNGSGPADKSTGVLVTQPLLSFHTQSGRTTPAQGGSPASAARGCFLPRVPPGRVSMTNDDVQLLSLAWPRSVIAQYAKVAVSHSPMARPFVAIDSSGMAKDIHMCYLKSKLVRPCVLFCCEIPISITAS